MRNTVAKLTFIILAFNVTLARKIISMKTLCWEHSSKIDIYYTCI